MGMGASCHRWDCTTAEDCTNRGRPWYDCAGQAAAQKAQSSASRDAELIAIQEREVQLLSSRFHVRKVAGEGSRGSCDWRRRYHLGRELGAGQTATVFEAYTSGAPADPHIEGDCGYVYETVEGFGDSCASGLPKLGGRKVALKRFHNAGSVMFQQELKALTAVGVHPNILRLLESFEGNGEDVLVLEHCDGGDVYELYAANNGCSMLESFVLQIIRQLLLALEHLASCNVEHRDVKPENLLLFGCPSESSGSSFPQAVPLLKLADFGWAVAIQPGGKPPPVPPEGVGSLWYAPPELNPPVPGAELDLSCVPLGRSDMWSVGIIAYLLLIGHSPFNPALRVADPVQREMEVIRLAALGDINVTARPWGRLSEEARSFITALIQPNPLKRLSLVEAWGHPWIARWQCGYVDVLGFQQEVPPPFPDEEPGSRWKLMDGFQRLCWLAFARAASEPELIEVSSLRTFVSHHGASSGRYLERLAGELASAAAPSWFRADSAWSDVVRLAFQYLDVDADGILSHSDLLQHMAGADSRDSAETWLRRWRKVNEALPVHAVHGLGFVDFRRALSQCTAGERRRPIQAATAMSCSGAPTSSLPPVGAGQKLTPEDREVVKRMEAIDQVCQRFLDEEFDDYGYGF